MLAFGAVGKDLMNEETVELLFPYLDVEGFTPEVAKKASGAAEGLCIFVAAMKDYFYAARIVKPKLEALSVAMAQLDAANKEREAALLTASKAEEALSEQRGQFVAARARVVDRSHRHEAVGVAHERQRARGRVRGE